MIQYIYRQFVLIKSGGGTGSCEAAATGRNANGANSRIAQICAVEDEGVHISWLPERELFC